MFTLEHLPTTASIVALLNQVACGALTHLSLPVESSFIITAPSFPNLSMPSVDHLGLLSNELAPYTLRPDLYSFVRLFPLYRLLVLRFYQTTHVSLHKLLHDSFPSLTSLHLRGWFDTNGTLAIASTPLSSRATTFPLVYILLGSLHETAVVQLRISSSEGHPVDADAEFRFEREGGTR